MRTVIVLAATLLSLSLAPTAAELSAMDRQRLIAHMDMTAGWLADELADLSQAQAEFRRAQGSWNILEVLEHLVVVGPIYWQDLQKGVAGKPPSVPLVSRDADILWYGIDRTNRQKTGEARVPKGKYANVSGSLGDLRKLRATITEFAKSSQEDLRGRQLKGGNMDVYQWLLMISTHLQRHILQIREVKAHPSYPKK